MKARSRTRRSRKASRLGRRADVDAARQGKAWNTTARQVCDIINKDGTLPRRITKNRLNDDRVLIAGAGPAGLVAAANMARAGGRSPCWSRARGSPKSRGLDLHIRRRSTDWMRWRRAAADSAGDEGADVPVSHQEGWAGWRIRFRGDRRRHRGHHYRRNASKPSSRASCTSDAQQSQFRAARRKPGQRR